jgi:hypothetical protein
MGWDFVKEGEGERFREGKGRVGGLVREGEGGSCEGWCGVVRDMPPVTQILEKREFF